MVIKLRRYYATIEEDHGDTLYLSCTCGEKFVSDAFGENVLWVEHENSGANVPQCPGCHTVLE